MVPSDLIAGIFANAFRLVRDTDREWFLDFLAYSAAEDKAIVVARVRVLEEFILAIRKRLGDITVTNNVPQITSPGPTGLQ